MGAPDTIRCPRCWVTIRPQFNARFCPRCGLKDVGEAALDTSPLEIATSRAVYSVMDTIAPGAISTVYRCRWAGVAGREVEGVIKVARDARSNRLIAREADTLRRLYSADIQQRYTPFLPAVQDTLAIEDAPELPPRQAVVLRYHPGIELVDELYTLSEVRAAYGAGLDPRDMAWVWRRLLSVLGFIHSQDIVHCAVLPMHILIEPREHKLVLVDWCSARETTTAGPMDILHAGHADWYPLAATRRVETPTWVDLVTGARCMVELLGGHPVDMTFPATVPEGLRVYFLRCMGNNARALDMLDAFDRLIEALWGPRKFRPLAVPPRPRRWPH